MASENYVNLQLSEEQIRLTVLTNICRMLVNRGYMDADKYAYDEKRERARVKNPKIPHVEQPTIGNKIDNDLFLPFIENRSDNNIYSIPLDTPYRDEKENDLEFDGSVVIVKMIPQDVKDITNSPILNEFFKTYSKYHKIIVFNGMADKVYNTLRNRKNTEAFTNSELMIDLMSVVFSPESCKFVTLEELSHISNPKFSKIMENDPLCKYYNGKQGQVMRITSPSINNCVFVSYRKVIQPKANVFVK